MTTVLILYNDSAVGKGRASVLVPLEIHIPSAVEAFHWPRWQCQLLQEYSHIRHRNSLLDLGFETNPSIAKNTENGCSWFYSCPVQVRRISRTKFAQFRHQGIESCLVPDDSLLPYQYASVSESPLKFPTPIKWIGEVTELSFMVDYSSFLESYLIVVPRYFSPFFALMTLIYLYTSSG